MAGAYWGGQRDYFFVPDVGSAESSGGIVTIGGPASGSGNVQMNYDGADGGSAVNSYGLGSVDLTGGGTNDRFLIDVTSLIGTVNLRVRVWEDTANVSTNLFTISSAGFYEVLFSSLSPIGGGAVLSSAEQVGLWVEQLNPEERIQINEFSAGPGRKLADVPEPASIGMLGAGLGVFLLACAAAALPEATPQNKTYLAGSPQPPLPAPQQTRTSPQPKTSPIPGQPSRAR